MKKGCYLTYGHVAHRYVIDLDCLYQTAKSKAQTQQTNGKQLS